MIIQVFSAADVVRALPMAEAIEGMKAAFAQLSSGEAQAPLRTHLTISPTDTTLVMGAFLPQEEALGIKVVSIFGSNEARNLPLIHALVLLVDAKTGAPQALLNGGTLTAVRTGAASGAATDILARKDATTVAIIGAGAQARTQLEAVCTVRHIRKVMLYSRSGAESMAAEVAGQGPIPKKVLVADSPAAAVREADIICTATTSTKPVFDGRDLQPGTHVNAVGSFTPSMQEIDPETIQKALVVVDSREAALEEAGDLIIPIRSGILSSDHIAAELGEIVLGEVPGRTADDQITYFKSVGVAVQDAIAAQIVWKNGRSLDQSTTISL